MKHLSICWACFFFLMDWLPTQALAQDRAVSGRVLEATGASQQGVPGATVRALGPA